MRCVKCVDNEAAFCAPCSDKWFGDPAFKKGLKQGRVATVQEIAKAALTCIAENRDEWNALVETIDEHCRLREVPIKEATEAIWSLIGGKPKKDGK